MTLEISFGSVMRSESHTRRDQEVAARAAAQHGVITRAQLAEIGFGERAIDHRIARGLLHPIHRGVYAVGHLRVTREAWWLASVLAGGPRTVLGFRSAAALWSMRTTSRSAVEVIAPRVLRRPGIEAHRIVLPADEVTDEPGIPVTTPARTLFDLAAVVTPDQLEHAFNEAEYRRLSSPTSLDALLARYPRRKGNAAVRRVLENHRQYGEIRTRSDLERDFVAFLDAYDLPRPNINRVTDHGELDAAWPAQKLVVELDGFAAHGTRRAFEADRARDRALVVAGWRVIRLTARQLEDEPDTIARQLRTLLDGASPSPRSAGRARRPPPPTRATRSAAP